MNATPDPAAHHTDTDAAAVVAALGLTAHPEGGWFRETWRDTHLIPNAALPDGFGGDRSVGTAIHYLATPTSYSALHRIRATEVFHFYAGDSAFLFEWYPDGTWSAHHFGSDVLGGEAPQIVVAPGTWFGLWVPPGGRHGWTLTGCTVSPGFDFADFELTTRAAALALAGDAADTDPDLRTWLERLTPHG